MNIFLRDITKNFQGYLVNYEKRMLMGEMCTKHIIGNKNKINEDSSPHN